MDEGTLIEPPQAEAPRSRTLLEHALMSGYWFGSNFVWGALLGVMLPSQMGLLAGKSSAATLGFLMLMGSIWALLVPLIAGPLSDRCRHKMGRRRPYMVVGGLVSVVGMALMLEASLSKSLPIYFVGFFILQFGANTALASYSGVIPDLVRHEERGLASGAMAFATQIGTLAGVLGGAHFVKSDVVMAYVLLIVVFVVSLLLTFIGVQETPYDHNLPPIDWKGYFFSLVEPLKSKDFAWVWLTRAMMMFGFYAIEPFILYYLEDVIHLQNAEEQSAKVIGAILVAATFSGLVAGPISDHVGRKPIVYLSSAVIGLSSLAFILCHTLTAVLIVGLVFGLGYGAYVSVDWALGTDVLPSKDDSGKDMGVWHVSMTMPQLIAPLVCGLILKANIIDGLYHGERLAYGFTGYVILFVIASASFLAGAYFVKNVRGVR